MAEPTDGFEQFFAEMRRREPETLRGMIEGWTVLESRGSEGHRLLLLENAQGQKRVLKQFSHEQNARMRAELEALNHAEEAGIPKLYDYAEDERYVYLLREYVEGRNLEELVAECGTLPAQETVRIGIQLCDVLARLHRRNIIHRDVKPQNVIMTPDGSVYLIDFDISRKYTEGEGSDTEYLGTRGIAPPEQFGYGQTDARTDLYSLGVVLLYLSTGSYDLRAIPRLPRALARVVRGCTYFAPEQRYRSAAQVRRRLTLVQNLPRIRVASVAAAALLLGMGALAVWLHPAPRTYPTLQTLSADAIVTLREPLIAQCVRAQLGKPANEPLRAGELAAVTELYLYGDYTDGAAHDPDYRGDQVFVNGVQIAFGTVSDLSDLLYMPALRALRLYRQPITQADALAPLTRLEELSLDECPTLTDVAAIAKLPNLRLLDLSDTAVTDMSPLNGCPKLRQINLERVPCRDFSPLARYPYLEYLNVNEAPADAVLRAVSGKMIDYLWLDYAHLTDIRPFAQVEGLIQLHAKHNDIRSLEGIEALTALEYVDVAYNPIDDLTPLLALPKLKALRIDKGMAAAWEGIAAQAKFKVEWES